MKPAFTIILLAAVVALLAFQAYKPGRQPLATTALESVKLQTKAFISSTAALERNVREIDEHKPLTVLKARVALKISRYQYKGIEYFMEYFFKSSAHVYNAPAKIEVEEPELEYQEPVGFQVIENLLYKKITAATKNQLIEQVNVLRTSAQDIPSLFYQFEANDEQVMESIRQELIRIVVLNITGYDAPLLKSGISESVNAMKAIGVILASQKTPAINSLVKEGIVYLESHPDFDRFDRMYFIVTYIMPLQNKLGTSLFNRNFLKADSFYMQQIPSNPALIVLGKRLFFEQAISGNGRRSCAGCHQPEKYFTDGLSKSTTLDGHGTISRNAPTLLYAAYQYSQDWDGKARSIEEQVINVMHNKDEMGADSTIVIRQLNQLPQYTAMFGAAFKEPAAVSISHLSTAIGAYLRTLAPFNSAFDRYIHGSSKAMTHAQIDGFNLFMGKAQCGTCHFAPVFNGLTPPGYSSTEYEILGTPLTDDLKHPRIDPDLGRYAAYPSKYYRAAFKTPTLRDVAKTAPYMHNGNFHTLKAVLNFYNKGGGQGLGLNIPEQTLSANPLKLSPKETKNIIAFLHALTDQI